MRIKLTIEYDGTAYAGWQRQANAPSIQQAVEGALESLTRRSVSVEVAGRTDAGVHALGQVVAFDDMAPLPLSAYHHGLNSHLPPDVAVVRAERVSDDFDPRRWAVSRWYRYLAQHGRSRSVFSRGRAWELWPRLDVEAMSLASSCLIGEHDFSAFRSADCGAKHPVRTMYSVAVGMRTPDEVTIDVVGTAFLRSMVRNIVGSLVEVGRGRRQPEWIAEVLASRQRIHGGETAPAHGLYLMRVDYPSSGPPPHARRDGDPHD